MSIGNEGTTIPDIVLPTSFMELERAASQMVVFQGEGKTKTMLVDGPGNLRLHQALLLGAYNVVLSNTAPGKLRGVTDKTKQPEVMSDGRVAMDMPTAGVVVTGLEIILQRAEQTDAPHTAQANLLQAVIAHALNPGVRQ